MSYRFYPLRDYPRTGLLIHDRREGDRAFRDPAPAQFMTLADAKKKREQDKAKGAAS